MAVYMFQVRLWVPLEGSMSLLRLVQQQLCAGCPISVGGEPPAIQISMALCEAGFEITEALTFIELSAQMADPAPILLNDETGPGYCDGNIQGPSLGLDGVPQLIFDQQIFTQVAGGTNPVGLVVYADTGDGDQIVGVALFDQPFLLNAGDQLKVSATLPLPAVIPLVE